MENEMKKNIKKTNKQINRTKSIDLLNSLSHKVDCCDNRRALDLNNKELQERKGINYERGIAKSFLDMSYCCRKLSMNEDGIKYLLQALNIFERLDDKDGRIRVLNLIGINYFYFGQYEVSLEYFFQSLELLKTMNEYDQVVVACVLNNIGEIYKELKKWDEALEYYKKGFEVINKTNRKDSMATMLSNIGFAYKNNGKKIEALRYYKKSISISKEIPDKISLAFILNQIGEIYVSLSQKDKAFKYYSNSLKIFEKQENIFYMIDVVVNLGNFYMQERKYKEALYQFKKGLKWANKIGEEEKICNIHASISQLYESIGKHREALSYYKKYHNLKNRIHREELKKKLDASILEIKIEKAKKEAEIYRLKNIELKKRKLEIELKANQLQKVNCKLLEEINARKKAQKISEYLRLHDALTGVYNREYFKLQKSNLKNKSLEKIGIIFCDVDGLKIINDTFGHFIGDKLIIKTAKTIGDCLVKEHKLVRIGGDEFVVFLYNVDKYELKNIASNIEKCLNNSKLDNFNLPICASIGYSLGNASSMSIQELIFDADSKMYRQKLKSKIKVNNNILRTIIKEFYGKNVGEIEHAKRVANICSQFSKYLNLPNIKTRSLKKAGFYHDVGKIILNNTKVSYEVKRHCEVGYKICKISQRLYSISEWILQHHEWWNGDGYPLNLKENQICYEAQIISIANVYDFKTYNEGLTKNQTINYIRSNKQKQFDPELAENFIKFLEQS